MAAYAENKPSEKRTLGEQLNYMGQLEAQFPESNLRVLYTASGSYMAAAVLDQPRAVIEHKLYWAPVATRDEGDYLCGILNAPSINRLVEPFQSKGAFGTRDFDKHVWTGAPIPKFDAADTRHQKIVELANHDAAVATKVTSGHDPLSSHIAVRDFQRIRADIRNTLDSDGVQTQLDTLLHELRGL